MNGNLKSTVKILNIIREILSKECEQMLYNKI